jgi:cytidylate kinase
MKLYLTASPRVRAERRVSEAGGDVDEIERSIAARDLLDSTRVDSPLTEAAGSTLVDTTGLDIEQVLDHIVHLLEHA